MALLRADFDYGDMIRWMGGEYTGAHRDWSSFDKLVADYRDAPGLSSSPPIDPDRVLRSVHEGVPLAGTFSSKRSDFLLRLRCDNHPPLQAVLSDVRAAFGKEEAMSYHLHFPRWVANFIPGLMLSPISWVVRKDKGRLVIDGSSSIHPNGDTGAPNSCIPKPSAPDTDPDQCPPVHFGDALDRHLHHVYNMRIRYPNQDLYQHTDDINAAFRRCLYHPDLAPAFSHVFMELLIIPVGMIFGSRSSPSFWDLIANWRTHLGTTKDCSACHFDIADKVTLEPPSEPAALAAIPPAVADSHNPGIPEELLHRGHIAMFVDDNCVIHIADHLHAALKQSVGSACDVLGAPHEDRRFPALRDDKFEPVATFAVAFLGYCICTRLMTLALPEDKRRYIQHVIDSEWLTQPPPKFFSPKCIATLLGLARHSAKVFPMGDLLSIRLSHTLSDAVRAAGVAATLHKRWWSRRSIRVPACALNDVRLLRNHLHDSSDNKAWSLPIGFCVPRDPTCVALSDAAYTGMGGWSPHLQFFWRIERAELASLGFPMKWVKDNESEPSPHDNTGLHINPLEFIALIINLWMSMHFLRQHPTPPGGHILLLRADNTTALSWMRHAARARSTPVRNLAFFAHALFLRFKASHSIRLLHNHIAGKSNEEADAVSRPELYPTLDSAMSRFPALQSCRHYLVPCSLLRLLGRLITAPKIAEASAEQMTKLIRLAPRTSPTGCTALASQPGTCKPSKRGRRTRSSG